MATVNELLAAARRRLERLEPREAQRAIDRGALLVDIRAESQLAAGRVPGARIVPRNALEWRVDPASPHRDPELGRPGVELIVMCQEGYQSSLAAATLLELGVRATDLMGGFEAWRDAGLPVEP